MASDTVTDHPPAAANTANAAAQASPPSQLKHLVIDSGAVITGSAAGLVYSAEQFWTVPAVLAEIRDKKARHLLDTLPYELKLREPSEEALSFAIGFARETGDLRSLSRVDLSVIALTYDLEKRETGAAHVKKTPKKTILRQPSAAAAAPPSAQQPSAADAAQPVATSNGSAAAQHLQEENTGSDAQSASGSEDGSDGDEEAGSEPDEELDMADEDYGSSEGEDDSAEPAAQAPRNALSSRILNISSSTGVTSVDAAEDDGIGWVTPANFAEVKSTGLSLSGPAPGGKSKGAKARRRAREDAKALAQCRAGCVTTDFAMQNVLLQMGLPLLSVNGMAVRRVKHWVLRCAACFKTTTDMEKLFCPVCGNSTLDKVSCSVDGATGQMRLHLNPKRKPNLRGTKYSIPKPGVSGRFNGDLLLREDQLMSGIWAQKSKRTVKSQGCMFGEHIMDGVGLSMGKQSAGVVVGYGRKNPNSQRGRERRGKGSSNR
ncbi:putative RNA binding protein NOB1 [Tribonema minus]|uniref:Putative RNA binding protein NOB1 n=1 Tax=Tribonema minus TaxID=303371 RepID=A0A835YK00_9STRA|nr:putative RNA binding protein NOB1 [Tribonema minus]